MPNGEAWHQPEVPSGISAGAFPPLRLMDVFTIESIHEVRSDGVLKTCVEIQGPQYSFEGNGSQGQFVSPRHRIFLVPV